MADVFKPYLNQIEDINKRNRMSELLNWVKETFPQLKQRIAWNQPMFTDHDSFIIGFSMAKQHMSIAPEKICIATFSEELTKASYPYTKEIIRVKWSQPLHYDLIEKMIAYNIEDKEHCKTFWR